ncbi:MAG: hypothetical protein A2Z97_04060 [Bdellovibrionales bacterium GWB1_52_6]|nr:MAG: hypothetical protein A2Z97_04060 [Bdellovibrionales bacterium GWB1_52_6]OFZ04681.1 MAG: hypothetical protein A2X97_14040 [Bdellovibrionales bacterium GWA1_52_35]
MNFEQWFESQFTTRVPASGIEAVLRLAAEGATVPFIARYRKEQTGNLDEVAVQAILDQKERWDTLLRRQTFVVGEIEHQKKLTPELKEKILTTFDPAALEDLYLPYKQKRKTKAALAKEAGLEPLADWIWNCGHGTETPQPGQTLEIWAFTFRNEEKGYPDAIKSIEGAQDILIERLSEMQDLRQLVRKRVFEKGAVKSAKGEKAKSGSKFENYFSFQESIETLLQPKNSHRYLAMRRGWMEEELILTIGSPNEDTAFESELLQAFEAAACTVHDSPGAAVLMKAARLSFKAHVLSSIENEVHKALKEVADEVAIQVFAENVRKLLMAAPFGAKGVLGVDPGIRTGCKIALVDDSGKYLASTVMHTQTEGERKKAATMLAEVAGNGKIRAIAVGNGTAGRETEIFIRGVLKELGLQLPVVMVNEAGASVYSASEVAREEFPDLDLTVRGAISIARRLQDPLAELVKVDPKSIGVGQYQHDVSQPALKRSLDFVVDSCVNAVGVNVNTASEHLLAHVSGIGPGLAKSLVEHRSSKGLFKSREDLKGISRFSGKAFEQAAGFLRIPGSENPLDNTGVHPERYPFLEAAAVTLGRKVKELLGPGAQLLKKEKKFVEAVGQFTFEDIVKELEKPGRDPREEFVPFSFREDIHEVKDLQLGMNCPGVVTNVTNFGAFVDIGVHQDGLVHISQLSDHFVKDPREVVNPGDRVQVRVLEVNFEKNQIALTMKSEARSERGSARQSQAQSRDFEPRPVRREPLRPQGPSPVQPQARPLPKLVPSSKPSKVKPKQEFKNNPFAALANIKVGPKS